jgi:hypothetical protein
MQLASGRIDGLQFATFCECIFKIKTFDEYQTLGFAGQLFFN